MRDSVVEKTQPRSRGDHVTEFWPIGMPEDIYEARGMGHEPENQAGGVADTSDGVDTAVGVSAEGICRIGWGVGEGDLPVVMEGAADVFIGGNELAFAVGDGEIEGFGDVARPD